jgi:hypothetical protein
MYIELEIFRFRNEFIGHVCKIKDQEFRHKHL